MTLLTPSQSSTLSLPRKVTFCEKVKARLTPHINNFTMQERKSYWYTPDEFKRIRSDISVTVQLIEMEIDISSSPEFCAQGLEMQTLDGARRRAETRQRVWRALSFEQESQRHQGINNEQALADIYAAQVQECRVAAHAKGLADQTHVQLSLVKGSSTKKLKTTTATKWELLTTAMAVEGSKKAALVQTIRHRHLSTQAA